MGDRYKDVAPTELVWFLLRKAIKISLRRS